MIMGNERQTRCLHLVLPARRHCFIWHQDTRRHEGMNARGRVHLLSPLFLFLLPPLDGCMCTRVSIIFVIRSCIDSLAGERRRKLLSLSLAVIGILRLQGVRMEKDGLIYAIEFFIFCFVFFFILYCLHFCYLDWFVLIFIYFKKMWDNTGSFNEVHMHTQNPCLVEIGHFLSS